MWHFTALCNSDGKNIGKNDACIQVVLCNCSSTIETPSIALCNDYSGLVMYIILFSNIITNTFVVCDESPIRRAAPFENDGYVLG